MTATRKNIVALPAQALTWLGAQGARAIAAPVFIGIAVPPLGELFKPLVTEAVFLLLCRSFLRVDLGALRDHLRRPVLVLAATAWTTIAVPLIALMVSQRNMGLMLAATDGVLPGATWLYFALSQFPIYLSPLMLGPIVRSGLSANQAASAATDPKMRNV
jgi:hypothetical protein